MYAIVLRMLGGLLTVKMSDRGLAQSICNVFAQSICDENNKMTLGGISLGEKLFEKLSRKGGYRPEELGEWEMACRHWVKAVGYHDGIFVVMLSDYIQNC